MKIALISRMDEREPRATKVLHSLSKRADCVFVGWNRFGDAWAPDADLWERDILQYPAGMGIRTALHGFRFRAHVARALERHRPDVVLAVNEETAYLIRNWKGKLYSRLVIDNWDEFDTRIRSGNPFLHAICSRIAQKARHAADAILCVSNARRATYAQQHQVKTFILPNYPNDTGAGLWNRFPQGEFRIFVGGALGESRGLAFTLAAADRADVKIISAGRLMDSYARDVFSKHPSVRYVGCLSQEEAMILLSDCHASVAFYEPGPAINRLAAPNKVYDALCVGRPILISDENEVADWVEQNDLGVRIKYGDVDGLASALLALKKCSDGLSEFAARARQHFLQGYNWESAEPALFAAVGIQEEVAVSANPFGTLSLRKRSCASS